MKKLLSKSAIGHLIPEDEQLNHQFADTFASVATTDAGWTEKVWCTMAKKDGSMQADFGLGRYHNRNVMDAFAGVISNWTQRTVRTSRELGDDLLTPTVGPIHYEIIEPLKKIRFRLEENDIQPISYDLVFEGYMPCAFEDRAPYRSLGAKRLMSDVIRYHQPGTVSGWINIDGTRHEVNPDEWYAYRDHSWGTRSGVGSRAEDMQPSHPITSNSILMHWTPITLTKPDGSRYTFQHYILRSRDEVLFYTGHLNHEDGSQETVARVRSELRYSDETRMLIDGTLHYDMLSGETHSIEIESIENGAGFHLGPGLYEPIDGFRHGSWRGEYHEEGDCHENINTRKTLKKVHQLRDGIIRARHGDAEGNGIFESIVVGDWPEFGLTTDSNYY